MSESSLDLFEAKANHERRILLNARKYKVSVEYFKLEFELTPYNEIFNNCHE